ncbi:hypothetical protein EYF80_064989 [Liparis tanakae]|uniref:Uncharacterized protein n=1 Tax=Liparis tanakae TaxID=230148 RepID=A0A4Z2E7Z9_9TELE|nr:hypothetical protein EYF80_064989 [Liparis tanakae]
MEQLHAHKTRLVRALDPENRPILHRALSCGNSRGNRLRHAGFRLSDLLAVVEELSQIQIRLPRLSFRDDEKEEKKRKKRRFSRSGPEDPGGVASL